MALSTLEVLKGSGALVPLWSRTTLKWQVRPFEDGLLSAPAAFSCGSVSAETNSFGAGRRGVILK